MPELLLVLTVLLMCAAIQLPALRLLLSAMTPRDYYLPAPVTVQCAADVPAVNIALVTATDNCAGTVAVTHVGDVSAGTCQRLLLVLTVLLMCAAIQLPALRLLLSAMTPADYYLPAPVTVQCAADVRLLI